MKRILVAYLICISMFLLSCSPATQNVILPTYNPEAEDNLPVTPGLSENNFIQTQSPGSSNNSASSIDVPIEQAETFLRAAIRASSFVIEGTVSQKASIYKDTATKDKFTFSNLEIIAGRWEEPTICIDVNHYSGDMLGGHNFYVERRYIVFVYSPNTQYTPDDQRFYQNYGVFCRLDENNEEQIDQLIVAGNEVNFIRTKQEIMDIIEEEIGFPKDYYNPKDQYVHSDEISEIVAGAPIIMKVRVDDVYYPSSTAASCYCICTPQKLYKGSLSEENGGAIIIRITRDLAEIGKEYIVMCKASGTVHRNGHAYPSYRVASKNNNCIPIDDTDRVQQVYDALGIQSAP